MWMTVVKKKSHTSQLKVDQIQINFIWNINIYIIWYIQVDCVSTLFTFTIKSERTYNDNSIRACIPTIRHKARVPTNIFTQILYETGRVLQPSFILRRWCTDTDLHNHIIYCGIDARTFRSTDRKTKNTVSHALDSHASYAKYTSKALNAQPFKYR